MAGLSAGFLGEMYGILRGCSTRAVKLQPAEHPLSCVPGTAAAILYAMMWKREGSALVWLPVPHKCGSRTKRDEDVARGVHRT